MGDDVLYGLILGCEVAFWIALFTGLSLRYVFRWMRASTLALVCVPLIDIALLAFAVADLLNGAQATFAHGLATAYVGFTVAFGSVVIDWADQRFAHRFANGPVPRKAPTNGWAAVVYELKLWGLCVVAVCIVYILLTAIMAIVDRPEQLKALGIWYRIPLGTAFFWFIFGPLWQLVFFRRATPA